jgi:cell division protein FtsI (penicillin-binding protein 3)
VSPVVLRRMSGNEKSWDQGLASRLRALAVVFPLLFAFPALKALYHQTIGREGHLALVRNQSTVMVKVPARRGAIYDRTERELAVTLTAPSVYACSDTAVDREHLANALAPVLEEDPAYLLRAMESGRRFAWLKRQVTPAQADAARRVNPLVVGWEEDSRRHYPNAGLAAAVLGFVGKDGGLEGIERGLQDHLGGRDGLRAYMRDGLKRRSNLYAVGEGFVREPIPGSAVTLTLDSSVQYFAEQALAESCERSRASGGAAVVLDARNGAVLAMASWPSFDPNGFSFADPATFRNRAIQFTYEPGSTLKVFAVGAALEEKVIDERAAIFCDNGRMKLADRVIRDDRPHGWLTLTQVMARSSNIGVSKIGLALGRDRLDARLRLFGFGSRVDLMLPGEEDGTLRPAPKWTAVDTACISFGQSMAVTPLQMASAYNALANGGLYVKPYLVERIVSPAGRTVYTRAPDAPRRALARETADRLVALMRAVTAEGGTGTEADIPGYRVAGKTGTAQKFDTALGRYDKERFVASFAGFAPAERPVVTAIVVVDEPQGASYHGGQVAAPPWREMVGKTLKYLGVAPDPAVFPDGGAPAVDPRPHGPELVRAEAAAPVRPARHPVPPPAPGTAVMPDLAGMTLREALRALFPWGCEVQTEGAGVVVAQEPPAGETLTGTVLLTLEPRVKI